MSLKNVSACAGRQVRPEGEGNGQQDDEITDLNVGSQTATGACRWKQIAGRIWENLKNLTGLVLSILLLIVTLLLSPIILPLALLSVYIEKRFL